MHSDYAPFPRKQFGKDFKRKERLKRRRELLLADWRYEVANGDTYLGFADWVDAQTAALAQL